MATNRQSKYFAVKLVAPRVGDTKLQSGSVPGTVPTRSSVRPAEVPEASASQFLTIGGKTPAAFHGVAGHFTANVFDFNSAQNAACKTVAEAEQLVKKKQKAWLADAYDWFVIPVFIDHGAAGGAKAARTPGKK